MSAAEVIAESYTREHSRGRNSLTEMPEHEPYRRLAIRRADAALSALADAGFAVVKLPDQDPQGCFSAGGGTRVMVTSDGRITNGYAIRESVDEARALAGALLAAAAQLEGRS